VLIVAIKKETDQLIKSLSPETVLEKGDRLICVGKPVQVDELARLAGSPRRPYREKGPV